MSRSWIAAPAARIAAVLVALVAVLSLSGCGATARESDGPVYLVNNTTAIQYAAGSTLDWNINDGVVLSALPLPAPPADATTLALPAPAKGESTFIPFIAPNGKERSKGDWKLWGDSWKLDGKGALLPSVCPGCLINGNADLVKKAGGTYSMGVAYLKDGDQTVVSAYFTTITIDAGTGSWKFDTPS